MRKYKGFLSLETKQTVHYNEVSVLYKWVSVKWGVTVCNCVNSPLNPTLLIRQILDPEI